MYPKSRNVVTDEQWLSPPAIGAQQAVAVGIGCYQPPRWPGHVKGRFDEFWWRGGTAVTLANGRGMWMITPGSKRLQSEVTGRRSSFFRKRRKPTLANAQETEDLHDSTAVARSAESWSSSSADSWDDIASRLVEIGLALVDLNSDGADDHVALWPTTWPKPTKTDCHQSFEFRVDEHRGRDFTYIQVQGGPRVVNCRWETIIYLL